VSTSGQLSATCWAITSWTKSTSQDNKALRVVSGSGGGTGGSTAFTSVFGSRAIPNHY
jgi:hypothetical protein